MAEELTFHLEDFDGPLELLLALVAKHKMDLHNIPILELIDQYTRTVEQADPDPETASAFIEMAAHLVEMKSYLLLPRSEEGERMKQEFTGQLIEYDQCRRMAALLRAKGEQAPVFVRQPMEMERDNTYTRVVYILRSLISGAVARMGQLFSPRQSRSTNVATFLALLELVRGGRVTLGENGELTMQRTRIKEKK